MVRIFTARWQRFHTQFLKYPQDGVGLSKAAWGSRDLGRRRCPRRGRLSLPPYFVSLCPPSSSRFFSTVWFSAKPRSSHPAVKFTLGGQASSHTFCFLCNHILSPNQYFLFAWAGTLSTYPPKIHKLIQQVGQEIN